MDRARRWIVVVLGVGVISTGISRGERYQEPEYIRSPPVLPPAIDADATRWSLQETLQAALRSNPGVRVESQRLLQNQARIAQVRGSFEPVLEASVGHRGGLSQTVVDCTVQPEYPACVDDPAADLVSIRSSNRSERWGLGVKKRFQTGTVLTAGIDGDRDERTEPYGAGAEVSLSQPLWRGFSWDLEIPRSEILRAERVGQRSQAALEATQMRVLRDAEAAYWDVVEALKSYQVEALSLELAREQLRLTQRQVEAGVLPPSDVNGAESTVARRELSLVRTEAEISDSWDRLRVIINLPRDRWEQPILPTDMPAYEEFTATVSDAFAVALERRREVQSIRSQARDADLDVVLARNQRAPALDLRASYGVQGRGSTLGDATRALDARDDQGWSVFLTLSWEPRGLAGKAEQASKRAAQAALELETEALLSRIYAEVRGAVRELETVSRQVHAAARFRVLAVQSLDAEQKRFLNGISSNIFVAQRQEELAAAQLAELAAVVRHQKARTHLALVTGTLLDRGRRTR